MDNKTKAAAVLAKMANKKKNNPGDKINMNLPKMQNEKDGISANIMESGGGSRYGFGGEAYGDVNMPVLQRGQTNISAGANYGFGGYRSSNGMSGFDGAVIPTVGIKKTIGSKKSNSNKKQ